MAATAILEKMSFGNGYTRPQLVSYELQSLCRYLKVSPQDIAGAHRRSQIQHKIPLYGTSAPLLLEEGLGLPISLTSAFQTLAYYQRMNWELASSRKYLVTEVFRQYIELLFRETVELCLSREFCLDLALPKLVITFARGLPQNLQLRQVQVTKIAPQVFINHLLEQNLRPMVAELVGVSAIDPELLWDTAIEALLRELGKLELEPRLREQTRRLLMIEELNPGQRVILLNSVTTQNPTFARDEWLYTKRKCCQSFRMGNRCRSCPGLKKM